MDAVCFLPSTQTVGKDWPKISLYKQETVKLTTQINQTK